MWKTVRLSDVCELVNGRAYKKSELLSEGKYTVLRVGNFFTSNKWYFSDLELDGRKYCDTGDLLYAWSASFGARIWEGGKVIYHYHIWKVIPDEDLIDKRFLFYWFEFDKEKIKAESGTGTTMMHVSKGSMEIRELLLPPLEGQRAIVVKLDAAFAEIDRAISVAKRNAENAVALFRNYLNETFRLLIGNSTQGTLKDVSNEFGRGKSKHRPRNDPKLYGNGYPFIQTGDVSNSEKYITSFTKSYNEFGLKQSKLWNRGTVCITIAANIAEIAILDIDACFPDSVIGLFPDETKTSSEYLFYLLQYFQGYIQSKSKGSAQQNINLGTFENELFPFPNSVEEQNDIVMKLRKLNSMSNDLRSIQNDKTDQLVRMKSSLLTNLLSQNEAEYAA